MAYSFDPYHNPKDAQEYANGYAHHERVLKARREKKVKKQKTRPTVKRRWF